MADVAKSLGFEFSVRLGPSLLFNSLGIHRKYGRISRARQ